MQLLPRKGKKILLKIITFILFYALPLKPANHFVNTFQSKKNCKGKSTFPFVKKQNFRNIQILIYHRVNDDSDPFFPATPTSVFAKQMEYLASHFNICPLGEAIERMKRNDVQNNTVVVTFDDGYRDNYINAFPILRSLSIPSTIFLATDAIGSGRVLWHDRVFSAFRRTRMEHIEGFGNIPKRYSLKTLEEKIYTQQNILKFLWSINNNEKSFWIDRLMEILGVEDNKLIYNSMLSWDDITIMYNNGVNFGSHTVKHPILSMITPDEAKKEIYESKIAIEEKIGAPVKLFAYPKGKKEDFNEGIKDILKEQGYVCGLTTIFGTNDCNQDLFEMRRVTPWSQNIYDFGLKLHYYKLNF
jgi:peptidoglycan/xylan/chitin deacetylase (PgdA/CDA1 family)